MCLPGERKEMEGKCMHIEMSELHENFWSLPYQKKSGLKITLCMNTWNICIHSFECIFIYLQSQIFKWYTFPYHICIKSQPGIYYSIWKRKVARDIVLNIYAILKEIFHRISWGLFKCIYWYACPFFLQENDYFKKIKAIL